MKKPNLMLAQEMLHDALINMCKKCGFTNQVDYFLVIMLAQSSAVATEMVSSAKITTPEDVEKLVKFGSDQFASFLREDLTERMLKERAERRH